MLIGIQRAVALLTTVAVLIMSIDCTCAGGTSAIGPASRVDAGAGAPAMSCCSHHQGDTHHCSHEHDAAVPHRPDPCSGACEHCGQAVMNDGIAPPSLGLHVLPHGFNALAAIDLSFLTGGLDFSPSKPLQARQALPPPLTSPTLLSQHCALII